MANPDIKNFSLAQLQGYFLRIGEKPFRARQVFEWIYQKGVEDFSAMTSLPAGLREQLVKDFRLGSLTLETRQVSVDGTRKFLFHLADGEKVESVLIPAAGRRTVCVSTQAGCKFGCRFCASGIGGFKRHLTPSEILGQILHAQREGRPGNEEGRRRVSHVVFMGIGEPLDNYDHVLSSIRILNASEGFGIAARHITISTCGLIPQMRKLAEEGLQIELSVSLHGYDDASRAQLMPVSKKYPFAELIKVCREYTKATRRQITFEYVMIRGLTVTSQAPLILARALKGMLAKVNLIPYNSIKEFSFTPPSSRETVAFRNTLIQNGIPSTIRTPRGQDIAAACGQLRHAQISKK